MSHWDALVDQVANELATWPGVHVERRSDGAAVIRYEPSELGVLHPDRVGWSSCRSSVLSTTNSSSTKTPSGPRSRRARAG